MSHDIVHVAVSFYLVIPCPITPDSECRWETCTWNIWSRKGVPSSLLHTKNVTQMQPPQQKSKIDQLGKKQGFSRQDIYMSTQGRLVLLKRW